MVEFLENLEKTYFKKDRKTLIKNKVVEAIELLEKV